jgi:hypothetical protein
MFENDPLDKCFIEFDEQDYLKFEVVEKIIMKNSVVWAWHHEYVVKIWMEDGSNRFFRIISKCIWDWTASHLKYSILKQKLFSNMRKYSYA